MDRRAAGDETQRSVRIPRTADGRVDAKIELSPLAVFDDEDAAAYVASHGLTEIARGAELSLD